MKLYVNDYESARAAWLRAANREKGKPLGKYTRLVELPGRRYAVQFLHKFSRSVETEGGGWRTEGHEVWRNIVTYRPGGSVFIDPCGIGDRTVWDRINDYSPVMTYKQGWYDYIRFFRFEGKDYVYGHSGVAIWLPSDRCGRPRYGPSTNASYKDKEFRNGRPCIPRAVWNEREADQDEVRHLLNRLGYLITKHDMWACLGYQAKRHIEQYLREQKRAEEARGKRSGARIGKQLRSIDLESAPCGDLTTQEE